MGDGVHVSADATRRGRAFGASLHYEISEPQKVNKTSLMEWGGSDVIRRLKQGFLKFKEERFLKECDLFSELADRQQPKVMVIACADSRVCPTMLLGLNPGEVFTVRNVANLVPPCEKNKGGFHGTSAALEFAVTVLKVEHIIVIGHRNCGGIKALMSRKTTEIDSDFIGGWMHCASPAKDHTLIQMEGRSFLDQCGYCEQEAINGSLANLLSFPWIKESFDAGKLDLHGWYYDFVEGELTSWEVQFQKSFQRNEFSVDNEEFSRMQLTTDFTSPKKFFKVMATPLLRTIEAHLSVICCDGPLRFSSACQSMFSEEKRIQSSSPVFVQRNLTLRSFLVRSQETR